ncbi:MAG: DUF1571 domain-containing protein [Pirellulales bacterium]
MMVHRAMFRMGALVGLFAGAWLVSSVAGQVATAPDGSQPGRYTATNVDPSAAAGPQLGAPARPAGVGPGSAAQPGEHPLMPALRWAYTGLEDLRNVKDYSATLVKRERISGTLGEYQYIFTKVRHKPFSVYMYFLGPASLKGQEALYVEGQNDNKVLGHGVGVRKVVGTVSLKPTSTWAMQGNRYPITEVGILNLTQRLVQIGETDSKYGECEVKIAKGCKISPPPRRCTLIEVVHPVPRRNFLFNKAQIFVDEELNVPIRYAAYDWPKEPGGEPQLTEEYTYLNLKLNNGFTDADFSPDNPNYHFR